MIEANLVGDAFSLDQLIPTRPGYFIRLCGPLPADHDVEAYLSGPLMEHRQRFFKHDLRLALSLTLPGNLRNDVSPLNFVSERSDEEIWTAIQGLSTLDDPMSRLGLLQLALSRRKSKLPFREFALNITKQLCGANLLRHDGKDVYAFYPLLVELTLAKLRMLEGLAAVPPFWHRLCAFTHAGLLVSLMNQIDFDSEEMAGFIEQGIPKTPVLDVLAFRSEPMWRNDYLTKNNLRAETIGRMSMLIADKKSACAQISKQVKQAMKSLQRSGLSPFLSGPLEGHLRPINKNPPLNLPDEISNKIKVTLGEGVSSSLWNQAANLSAIFVLPKDLRSEIASHIPRLILSDDTSISRLTPLFTLALVAVSHQDEPMSQAIAERCIREASESSGSIQNMLLLLLLASCAFPPDRWEDRFLDWLYPFALRIPAGTTKLLRQLLENLKRQLPISSWRFGRIEALCTTASAP